MCRNPGTISSNSWPFGPDGLMLGAGIVMLVGPNNAMKLKMPHSAVMGDHVLLEISQGLEHARHKFQNPLIFF